LVEFFDDATSPYYLLGDVIVVESREREYDLEIIDGQQRITTAKGGNMVKINRAL